jgi:hypothetical protein
LVGSSVMFSFLSLPEPPLFLRGIAPNRCARRLP